MCEELSQLLSVSKVVDILGVSAGWMDNWAWVVVELSAFQLRRVEDLEGNSLLDKVDDQGGGVGLPALPHYLEDSEGVPDQEFPGIPTVCDFDQVAFRI